MARRDVREGRREQILEAAGKLLTEQGLEQVTFANICRSGNISNGLLTYHFRDKNELLLALFHRFSSYAIATMFQPLIEGSGTMRERLDAMFQLPLEDSPCAMGNSHRDLLLHSLGLEQDQQTRSRDVRQPYESIVDRITARLEVDRTAGLIQNATPGAARALISIRLGWELLQHTAGPEQSPTEIVSMIDLYLTTPPTEIRPEAHAP